MKIEHPLRLGRGLNERLHWTVANVRNRKVATAIGWLLGGHRRPLPPVTFILTRISPAPTPMDDDNLAGAWKAGRDEIARWVGIDDGKKHMVRYRYRGERGPWGIRIETRPGVDAQEGD